MSCPRLDMEIQIELHTVVIKLERYVFFSRKVQICFHSKHLPGKCTQRINRKIESHGISYGTTIITNRVGRKLVVRFSASWCSKWTAVSFQKIHPRFLWEATFKITSLIFSSASLSKMWEPKTQVFVDGEFKAICSQKNLASFEWTHTVHNVHWKYVSQNEWVR